MDCIIKVSGQEQKRFDFLSKKFGNRAALQALLDADPNVEIDGFISDVEIGNRVNALAFSVVNNLIQDAAGVTDSTPTALDLRPENLEPLPLDRAIRKSKNDLEIILDETLTDQSTEENKNKATRAYVTLQNFESLIPKIKERIEVYGLKLSELNNDLEAAYNDETNENTVKQHIYNMTHFEKSRLDSMSPSVKLFLATLPQKRFGENNQIEDVVDDLGMPVPVDFHFLYSTLSKNLADIHNFDEMMKVMESLGEEIPNIADIYEFMSTEEVEGKQIVINARGEKVNNFKSAFYTSFVNTYSNFMTVTTQEYTDSEGGKQRRVAVIPTNKRKFHKVLAQRWANEGARILNTPESARKKAWDTKLKTIFYPYSNESRNKVAVARKARLDKLNRANNKVVLEEVSHALEFLGINVSSQALSQLKKEMNGKEKGSFGKYVDETIGKMAESMWVEGNNIFKDESGNIAKLARIEAKISKDLAVESFMNGEGNQVHPINLPTHLTELFNEFKTKSGRYLDFIQDSFFENFKILKDFGDKNTMEIAQFDTIYDNDRGQGVPFDQLDPTSSIVSRLALFMNYGYTGQGNKVKANTSHAWMMMPTPADRSGTTIFKLKTLEKQDYSFMGLFDQGSEFKEWITGVVKGEFERIKKVRAQYDRITDKDKLIKEFHYVGNELGNGGYFNYYPELNQFLVTDETGDLKDIDFDSSEVQSVIQQAVIEQIQADLNYLEDIGVIEPLVINAKGDKTYYEFRPSKHVKSVLPSSTISDGNIMSFIIHSIIANHELSALFNGDLAYFKSGKREDGTRGAILENANKRAGLSSTPGRKLRIGEGAAAPEFRVAFMKDETVPSDLLSVFHNFLPSKQANKYRKTKSTDGQGFVSLNRYADILSGQGLLTPAMAQTIAELKKNPKDINWNNVTETLQPVKGFLHGQRFDFEFGAMVPRVLKYSLLPIFPASIVDNPTMQNIYSRMQKNNIDETVFNTAAKYGATNLNSIKSEGDLDFVTLSNEDWRIPQVVPYKTKTIENFGSQTRKLIMGNIKPEADYGGYTGEQLRARYQAAISQKLANSFKDVLTSISTNGKMDIAKVARKVLDDLSKNVFKSNSDFINKALEVVTLENGEIDTRIPMSFPAIKHKVESSLNSMIRKAVTKQDLPGFNAVVYSSIGYNKEGIKVSKNLKMARPSKDGKTILPAEIIASPQYFIQSLYKKLNKIEDKTSPDAQAIIEIVSNLKKGTLDINSIPESLRQTVIYRIPTQGKNSMLPGIIVGFSPEVLGSVVTLPAEVVTQSGMDYDIDKVYLELKHFDFIEGKFTEINEVKNEVKTRVTELFDENLELSAIGNELQYSQYLDTIFPDSKVKDIVYHGSDTQFEDFLEDNLNYFGTQEIAKGYGKNIYPVLIEIKKPYYEDGGNLSNQSYEDLYDKLDNSGADGFISNGNNLFVPKEPEQIHILGSKQDIEGFKKFVENTDIKSDVMSSRKLDNTIVESHYAVLTSPEHYEELITPNNSDTLETLMKEIIPVETAGRKWSSLATQDDFREKNQAGGVFIGIASIANTAHAVFQELGVTINSENTVPKSNEVQKDVIDNTEYPVFNTLPEYTGNTKTYAGIGSRETPPEILSEMKEVSKMLESYGYTLRSGGAQGADSAFESGTKAKEIFYAKDANEKTLKIAEEIHPAWSRVPEFGKKLMARNTFQVFGKNLDSPVDFVLAWTPDGIVSYKNRSIRSGGTGQAIEMASRKGIPVINLKDKDWKSKLDLVLSGNIESTKIQSGTPAFTQTGEGLKINGELVKSLSQVTNRDGDLISDDHIEIQTAAVDNASNPILGNLNINTITGSTYLFLVEAGLGLKYPTMLVNSPIIRELTRRTRMNEAIMGTEGAFQSALTELAKDRSIDISAVNDMDFDVSLTALEGSLAQYKEGSNFTSYDNDILLAFLTFRKYGNDMRTVQAALQIDNIGARQTLAANIIQQDKMAQVVGTYTNAVFQELGVTINSENSKKSNEPVTKVNIYAGDNQNTELSNFAIRPFTTNVETSSGEKQYTFQSVEQGFHFYKALVANNPQIAKQVLATTNGGQLKRLTNKSNLKMTSEQVKEWDDTSKNIMLNLMYDSYVQNPEAAEKLLATGDAKITHTQDNTRWKTDFPEVVMTVRDMLREEGFSTQSQITPEQKQQAQQLYSQEIKTQSVEDLNLIETIKLDREKYKNHSMEAYERFGLQGAVQIVGEVIEDATPVFRKVLRDFQTGIGGILVESDVRMLMNDFYTYLFANQGATEASSVTSPLANLEGRDVARLLMGNDSVGKRVLVAQRADLAEAKNDIKHTPNQFLQSLSVDTVHSSGYDVVSFNNTITKALTSDQKTMLTNEFLDMFNSENEYIQELAQDLFLYNFYTEGFSRGVNSFSEFIPAEIYEVMTGDQGQNLVDYFRDIRDSFDTASKFDTGTFLMRFLQNRGEGLKGMKDLRKMNPSQIKNFLASNPRVQYFIMRAGKGTVIGKRTGKASFVGIATPIGVKNIHVEYQSGNFISELTTSEDVLKKALYSEDVIETENSSCIF